MSLAVIVALGVVAAGAGGAVAQPRSSRIASARAVAIRAERSDHVRGLPAGAAAAADRPEARLPSPTGWPFSEDFSRTSGTGRLGGGAMFWTDWVDDADGASSPEGLPLNPATLNDALASAQGDYTYAAKAAHNDGADIFRAAVGVTSSATYWRVDWNTLADPAVPVAEWTFDTDDRASTGVSAWPGEAGVRSPGIDKALIVSSRGARLIDARTGRTIARARTIVSRAAQSFVVRIPRRVLPVSRTWRVRLAAGLADASGTGFAPAQVAGALPTSAGAPRVYNITFRTHQQEPPVFLDGRTDALVAALHKALSAGELGELGTEAAVKLVTGNFWSEDDQADTLAGGNVTKFAKTITWSRLLREVSTPQPLVRGYSDRWYVTGLHLGQGIAGVFGNNQPYTLSRIQPYAVYVPMGYKPSRPMPLTWLLHSLDVNYNQYGALNPRQLREECQQRDSICVSPEGFGPAGDWAGDAENDFWQVWRQVALAYHLDPSRTVLSGYSMGGVGSFNLGETYPDDFSEVMPLDGLMPSDCGSANEAGNVRWVPYVIANAAADELSAYPLALEAAAQFEGAHERYVLFTTTEGEHLATAAVDGFATEVDALRGTPKRVANPGRITYDWCSSVVNHQLGLGPRTVYWLSGLAQRAGSAGESSVNAVDGARPLRSETVVHHAALLHPADTTPILETAATWRAGSRPAATRRLSLRLTNVGALTVDTSRAKLPHGRAVVHGDGHCRLVLADLAPGTIVRVAGHRLRVGRGGRAVVDVGAGTTNVRW